MPIYPHGSLILNNSTLNNKKQFVSTRSTHHVHPDNDAPSPLLALPAESLAHITSFLDPASLFALARSSSVLYKLVSDDNTWHQAFDRQFLAHEPDSDDSFGSFQALLLRRSEDSWKKEFVYRWNLLRRWERSRSTSVTHTPHYSPVVSMHLMSDRSHGPALMTSSLQYGIVARSQPLSGKVLKGYINATDHGLGIGNPNAEFSPSVSACAISSEGWTVKVAWGYANGDVALATANKVMDPGRTSTKLVRCEVNDAHTGRISDVIWVLRDTAFITAGVDGTVKIWETKRLRCVWVLTDQNNLVPDPCLNVVANAEKGVIISTKQSGTTVVWSDILEVPTELAEGALPRASQPTFRLPPPLLPLGSDIVGSPDKLFLGAEVRGESVSFGLHYEGDLQFYRVNINLGKKEWSRVSFGKGLAPLQTFRPFLHGGEDTHSVVLTGDALGSVAFFDWGTQLLDDGSNEQIIPPFNRLDAHDDGAITSISCNSYVIVTGSARGTTKVWDSLTLRLLRSFPSPGAKPAVGQDWDGVSGFILERDLLFVSVGSRVMAWKAEPVKPHKNTKIKASTKSRMNATAKWQKRLEMKQDISESRSAADDEQAFDQRSYERQRAQLSTLGSLGLDEIEAVEYILMLSRDEEEARNRNTTVADTSQEGVFQDDFDDILGEPSTRSDLSRLNQEPVFAPSTRSSRGASVIDVRYQAGSPSRFVWNSTSPMSTKVQVTPPLRPEPMEAGFSTSPISGIGPATSGRVSRTSSLSPSIGDTDHFPGISSSSMSSANSASRDNSNDASASTSPRVSPSTSTSVSWSEMVRNRMGDASPVIQRTANSSSAEVHTTSRGLGWGSNSANTSASPVWRSPSTSWTSQSLLSTRMQTHGQGASVPVSMSNFTDHEEEDDADLKLAIELSLAEALSAQQI